MHIERFAQHLEQRHSTYVVKMSKIRLCLRYNLHTHVNCCPKVLKTGLLGVMLSGVLKLSDLCNSAKPSSLSFSVNTHGLQTETQLGH